MSLWFTDQPTSTALVFPGQGSQFVGMGQDLYNNCLAAKRIFDEADEALGFSLSSLCFNGPDDQLTQTINAQPAILTTSIAMLAALTERSPIDRPLFVAGHSLGEYSALVAAGSLAFADAVKVVRERGRLMEAAGGVPSGMAAVIGLEDARLTEICAELLRLYPESGIQVANYNSPGQTVITGGSEALAEAMRMAKEEGAKRVLPLQVSAGFHSGLMVEVSARLKQYLGAFELRPAEVPVVANVTALPICQPDEILDELAKQTYSPVQWLKSVEYMTDSGATRFIEMGPGKVLCGLIKRISKLAHSEDSEALLKQAGCC